jgi:hypothetical protein
MAHDPRLEASSRLILCGIGFVNDKQGRAPSPYTPPCGIALSMTLK